MLRLELEGKTLGDLDSQFRKKTNDIFNEAANEAVAELRAASPVGATSQLKNSWRVIPARRQSASFDTQVVVTNDAPSAFNRIFGRGPGLQPPIQPLERWIEAKQPQLEPKVVKRRAYALARRIAREGTQRYKTQAEPLGFSRNGEFRPGSIMDVAQKRIRSKLEVLNLETRSPF